ncbi:alpha/beta hydrolase [Gordonia sp. ABSL49_1]|uniref:alpha/beta fold hydrolase n=1 Tax=unclassified Gordonia (in: high G+C Gram-positive bacteria) TaxID=2657482 RepID=UPI001F0F1501|nr:alpha/beta hydrolase [Gordonia sp. ABSL49_1]MCH5645276.1 alpha/beta hydrolase [Gordonia sp. ABSL49_1]
MTIRRASEFVDLGLRDHGGPLPIHDASGAVIDTGVGPIVLLHGLMGRGRTWRRQVPWLRRYGRVFTFDAAFHTGADVEIPDDPAELATERFVADLAEILTWIDLGPAVLVGHSMGALHAWCAAAAYPELVSALVVEDMAPDFRGRTTTSWTPWFESWPDRFASVDAAQEMFGPVAGRYFYEAFDDGRLHGQIPVWAAIAEEWGGRDFWAQWSASSVPALVIEAEHTVTPPGQMRKMCAVRDRASYLRVPGAGHLVHDDAPEVYRGAVEAFLSGLDLSR